MEMEEIRTRAEELGIVNPSRKKKPKLIFYAKSGIVKNFRSAVTIAIFFAVSSAMVLIPIHSIPLYASICIPAALCAALLLVKVCISCMQKSIKCLEVTCDFMIIEYYRKGREFIPWEEVESIQMVTLNSEKSGLFSKINNRMHKPLCVNLTFNEKRKIPLDQFFDDELDDIKKTLCETHTKINGNRC